MSTIDIKNGTSLLTLAGAAILTTYTTGDAFQAGAAGVVGLQLWCTIQTKAASAVTTVTFAVETSNDNVVWAPTLLIAHQGTGAVGLEAAFAAIPAASTVGRRVSVPPIYIGTAKWVRVSAKANAAGDTGDAIGVLGTGW